MSTLNPIQFTFGNHTDIGRQRQANEDYYGTWPVAGGQLFVVCDGMGGHAGGAEASQLAVAAIHNHFIRAGKDFNPVITLHKAIEAANDALLQRKAEEPLLAKMGTTAVVIFIRGRKVWYAHIGDSRIYLSSAAGLQQLTRDHSFVQRLVDNGEIGADEALTHPRRNEITKAIGIEGVMEPAVSEEPLVPLAGDCLLLCSDGLTGMVSDATIQEVLRAPSQSLQEKAFLLISKANEAGGTDNVTVQIICFGEGQENAAIPKRNRSATIGLIITLPLMALAAWAGFRGMNNADSVGPADSTQGQSPAVPPQDSGARDSVATPLPVGDSPRTRVVTGAEQIPIAVPVRDRRKPTDTEITRPDKSSRLAGGPEQTIQLIQP